jgi:hypothetical protein
LVEATPGSGLRVFDFTLCWLTFIYPPFGRGIFVYTSIFGLLSSVAMIVRLLIGVNEERWKEAAASAA